MYSARMNFFFSSFFFLFFFFLFHFFFFFFFFFLSFFSERFRLVYQYVFEEGSLPLYAVLAEASKD